MHFVLIKLGKHDKLTTRVAWRGVQAMETRAKTLRATARSKENILAGLVWENGILLFKMADSNVFYSFEQRLSPNHGWPVGTLFPGCWTFAPGHVPPGRPP